MATAPPIIEADRPAVIVPKASRLALRIALCAVVVVGLLIVFAFDPTRTSFYPPCVFHELTGLWCPGCGSTRALHQIVHGRIAAALDFNLLVVLALPLLALASIAFLFGQRPRRWLPVPLQRPWIAWAIAIGVFVFAIFRNIPGEPFSWLAP